MLNKKGFTLIEVIVSIALIGLMAIAFLPSLANHFKWIVDTRTNITQSAFQSQLEIEKNINIIKERISELAPGVEIDSSKYPSMGITDKISDIQLFEDEFPTSRYPARIRSNAYQVESNLNANRKFVSWVGDKRLPELVVPEIRVEELFFLKEGSQAGGKFEYANYPGLAMKSVSNMFKNPENSFNRYRNDWYVSNPGFLIPIPDDADSIDEDFDMGRIYPSFPEDYSPVPFKTEIGSNYAYVSANQRDIEDTLTNAKIQAENPGRHIVYTITPFAKSLKMGSVSTFLPLYVYGPKNTDDLVLHLDASVIDIGDITSLEKEGDEIYLKNWKNTRPSLKSPYVNYNARQGLRAKMPVIKKTVLTAKTVPEIPFQEDEDTASVWGRSLGNKEADKMTSMKISNITLNNSFSIFMVMRKVAEPRAPLIDQPILSSEGIWSLSWIDDEADPNPNLSFDFDREEPDEEDEDFEVLSPSSLSGKLVQDEWYLVEVSSSDSEIKLEASPLKIGEDDVLEAIIGDPGESGVTSTIDIEIDWNGVEIAELLIYNSNIKNSTQITSYLTKKYKGSN